MIRGLFRRGNRRTRQRIMRQLTISSNSNSSDSEKDSIKPNTKEQLVNYFILSRCQIHPDLVTEKILLKEESLTEARELHERYLVEESSRQDLTPLERSRLIEDMTAWLNRVESEVSCVARRLEEIEKHQKMTDEMEELIKRLQKIPEDLFIHFGN